MLDERGDKMKEEYYIHEFDEKDIENETLVKKIDANKLIYKASTMVLWVFGIAGAIAALNVVLRQNSGDFFDTALGKIDGIVMGVAFVVYFIFILLLRYVPQKNWKCPHCGGDFSFLFAVGKKAHIMNRKAQYKLEEQDIVIGRVQGSMLIVPSECPHCHKKFMKDGYKL